MSLNEDPNVVPKAIERIRELTEGYYGNGDPTDDAVDLLADLKHFCAFASVDWNYVDRISSEHVAHETED